MSRPRPHASGAPRASSRDAFTLVELLVAAAILAMLIVLLMNMVNQVSKTWKTTSGKIEQFRSAREAFDSITRRIGQATLNTYLDYDNPLNPRSYIRQSELRFLSGPASTILGAGASNMVGMAVFFQAPNGFATNTGNAILQNALNTWGYFISYDGDAADRPGFVTSGVPVRYRYRLMELM